MIKLITALKICCVWFLVATAFSIALAANSILIEKNVSEFFIAALAAGGFIFATLMFILAVRLVKKRNYKRGGKSKI